MAKTPLPPVSLPQQQISSPQVETAPSQIDKEFTEINQQFSQLNLQYQQPPSIDTQPQQSYYAGEAVQAEVPNAGYGQGNLQEPTQDLNSYNQTQSEYQANESQFSSYNQPQQDQVDQSNYYSGSYAGYDQQPSLGYDSMQQQNSYDYYGQQSLGTNDEVSGV